MVSPVADLTDVHVIKGGRSFPFFLVIHSFTTKSLHKSMTSANIVNIL